MHLERINSKDKLIWYHRYQLNFGYLYTLELNLYALNPLHALGKNKLRKEKTNLVS